MKLILGSVIVAIMLIIAFAVRHKHKTFGESFKEAGAKSEVIMIALVVLFILTALYNNRERLN